MAKRIGANRLEELEAKTKIERQRQKVDSEKEKLAEMVSKHKREFGRGK